MELKELKYFRTIAELGTLSKAASRLRVAQPALSRQMGKLEHSLGVKLFRRGARGVTLTPAGMVLLQASGRVEHAVSEAMRDVASVSQGGSGLLRIGAQYPVSTSLLPRLIHHYHADFPYVSLHPSEGYSGEILDALLGERLEVAIVDPPSHPHVDLTAVPLWLSKLRLVAPAAAANTALFQESRIAMEQVAQLPLILPSRAHSLRRLIDQGFARFKVRLQPTIEAEGPLMIFEMVRMGLGYSIFSEAGFHPLEQQGEIISREISPVIRRTISIVTRTSLREERTVAHFIALAKEEARRLVLTDRFAHACLYDEPNAEPSAVEATARNRTRAASGSISMNTASTR
jgi:DNA-binding transcriptional LysR family regulator